LVDSQMDARVKEVMVSGLPGSGAGNRHMPTRVDAAWYGTVAPAVSPRSLLTASLPRWTPDRPACQVCCPFVALQAVLTLV
jgi:hypothetical protein